MRGHNEGTIYKLPSGKWRAQVTVDGRRLSKTKPTRRECVAWLDKTRGQVKAGMTYDGAQSEFATFLQEWLKTKKSNLRTQTFEQYTRLKRLYIIPELGHMKLKDLSAAKLQAFYDDMRARGKGARTIEVTHSVIHGCLEHAFRLGLVSANPADKIIIGRPKKKEMSVWNESQVSQFLVSIRGHRNEILYQLALTTGMRRGELIGLQWPDLDWRTGVLSIQRQVFRPEGGGWVFNEPKTERGKRAIQLGSNMLERLREQVRRVDELRKSAGDRWQEFDMIFPSSVGTPLNEWHVSNDFRHLSEDAGLPVIRFHDCRHTAASLMLSHGIAPLIVAGMLGHSLNVLTNRYAHFIPNMQDQAAALMDSLTSPVEVEL